MFLAVNFFDSVINFFETIIDIITQFLTSLFTAISFISSSAGTVARVSLFMPTIIGSCVLIIMSIGIVKFLVGR